MAKLYRVNKEKSERGFMKKMMDYVHFQALTQAIFLAFLSILCLFLLVTRQYQLFLHPRYEGVLWCSLPLLLLACWKEIEQVRKPLFFKNYRFLPTFLFPCVLLFLSLPFPFQNQVGLTPYTETIVDKSGLALEENTALASSPWLISQDPVETLPKVSGSIRITTKDYAAWLSKVLSEPSTYVGKQFTFLARINESVYAKEDYFLLGRPVMLCCAADSQNLGLFARLPEALKAEKGQWYYITAKVVQGQGTTTTQGESVVLEVLQYSKSKTPASTFAFYFGNQVVNEEVDE